MNWQGLVKELECKHGMLDGLQNEIGIGPAERQLRTQALLLALVECMDKHVDEVTRQRDSLRGECASLRASILAMRQALYGVSVSTVGSSSDEIRAALCDTLQSLKSEHENLQADYEERKSAVTRLQDGIRNYQSYFLSPSQEPEPQSDDLSLANISHLTEVLNLCSDKYQSKKNIVKEVASEIVNAWALLGTGPSVSIESTSSYASEFDRELLQNFSDGSPEKLGLRNDVIERLRLKRDELTQEVQRREQRLEILRVQIEPLWVKLNINDDHRETFQKQIRGCTLDVLSAAECELDRLLTLKRQNVKLFILSARDTLRQLWDKLYFTEDQALQFKPACTDIFTDALLASHESEISRLETIADKRKVILNLIGKRMTLLAEKDELALMSADTTRLLQQKGKRDPGRLLREEKLRKRVERELPKIESSLQAAMKEWEKQNGEPFLVYGQRYLDSLLSGQSSSARSRSANAAAAQPGLLRSVSSTSTNSSTHSRTNRPMQPTQSHRTPSKSTSQRQPPTPSRQRIASPTKLTTSPSKRPLAQHHAPSHTQTHSKQYEFKVPLFVPPAPSPLKIAKKVLHSRTASADSLSTSPDFISNAPKEITGSENWQILGDKSDVSSNASYDPPHSPLLPSMNEKPTMKVGKENLNRTNDVAGNEWGSEGF